MPAQLPPGDALAIIRKPTGPAREQALTAALDRFGAGRAPRRVDEPDGWVTAVRTQPAVEARYAPWPEVIDPRLRTALEARGIAQLYTHQAAVVVHALAGQDVVVTTPTASGKTLCHNAPVLSTILADPASRAPSPPTKALAEDQLAELARATTQVNQTAATDVGVFTYDGDTPQDASPRDPRAAHIVLSNPTCCMRGSCRTTRSGRSCSRTCASSSSTSCTCYRGVSAATSPTCCGACSASPPLLIGSGLHLLVGDDRQPARPRGAADPAAVRARRGERRAAWREAVPLRQPVGRQPGVGIRRSYLTEARTRRRPVLQRRRQLIVFCQSRLASNPDDVPQGRLRGPGPARRERCAATAAAYLPLRRREIQRRLREGQVARRRRHQRAGSGHRHRRARRRGARGLSGHHRLHVAARRPRRAAAGPIGGRDGRQLPAARPVRAAQPLLLLRRLARARAGQPRQPAHPARPHQVRRLRAAVRRRRALRPRRRAGDPELPAEEHLRSISSRTATRASRTGPASRIPPTR